MSLVIDIILRPKETFEEEVHEASFGRAALYFLMAGAVVGVYSGLAGLISSMLAGTGLNLAGFFSILILPFLIIFAGFFSSAFYWIIAKILGGKGSFSSLFYINSTIILTIAIFLIIPILNILLVIYAIYLSYLAIKISQELSTGRAVLTLFIPFIIQIILSVLLIALVFGAVASFFLNPTTIGLVLI